MEYKIYEGCSHDFIQGDTVRGEIILPDKCKCIYSCKEYEQAKDEYDYLCCTGKQKYALTNKDGIVLACTKDLLYHMAIDLRIDRRLSEQLGIKREDYAEDRNGTRKYVSAVKAKIEDVVRGKSLPYPTIDFIHNAEYGGVVFPIEQKDAMEFEIFPNANECFEMLRRTDRYSNRNGFIDDDALARYIMGLSVSHFTIDERGTVALGMEYADEWNNVPIGIDEQKQLKCKADEILEEMGMKCTVKKYYESKFGTPAKEINIIDYDD